MKKTLTVNLSGMVYHIDEDAYQKLRQYLETLEKKLKGETDLKDIILDIESRIAELLNDRLGSNRQVVILDDIEMIIEIMGEPEVITNGNDTFENTDKSQYKNQKKYRRMYRDPDNRVLGGVCSGLAAHWNMDPVLIRILIIVLTLIGGSGLIIYLILWIVMPEAKTTAQKLEMRGEAVTIDNIKRFVKEEFENVKRNFNSKKKSTSAE